MKKYRHRLFFTIFMTLSINFNTYVSAGDLYAYYTKIDSGEPWERFSLTGKYTDVVVHLDDGLELIFWRASSYLPHLKTDNERHYLSEIIPRSGDGTNLMPDRINQYSYVRIIENSKEKVIIHWRYMPDFNPDPDYSVTRPDFGNVDFTGVVHEIFTITPDGIVERCIKKGRKKLDDYNDPDNIAIQSMRLTANGIEQITNKEAILWDQESNQSVHRLNDPVKGAPVTKTAIGTPVVYFSFDEGLKPNNDQVIESVSGMKCAIEGPKTVFKAGVSGTALAFDGYWSKVTLPVERSPVIEDALTVEAWIAPGAYSISRWTGIVQHSNWEADLRENYYFDQNEWGERQLGERLVKGYFLGIDEFGHLGFQLKMKNEVLKLKSTEMAELYKWSHVAATLGNGEMKLYLNGKLVDSASVLGSIVPADANLLIGKSDPGIQYVARHTVRPFSTFPSELSFEGLIDEVKISNVSLDQQTIENSYKNYLAKDLSADMEPRILPGNPGPVDKFGARYTNLEFHELWDNMWRPSGYDDIIIKFDMMPTSILFWRGTRYGASYVTENNRWMSDQSVELTDWRWDNKPTGCNSTCEHMMDAQLRYNHVRLIENTDARVMVHWRYASADANYKHTNYDRTNNWGSWIDEYYTIYPDGVLVRSVDPNGCLDYYFEMPETPHFSALQILNPPGETVEEQLKEKAVTIANLDGETQIVCQDGSRLGEKPDDAAFMTINYNAEYRMFIAYQTAELIRTQWGWEDMFESVEAGEVEEDEEEDIGDTVWIKEEQEIIHTSSLFTGPWNHWPVSQFPCDGRNCVELDRVGSSELNAGVGINAVQAGSMIMYGLTNQDARQVAPMVKSWNYPAPVRNAGEIKSHGYNKSQRAYLFTALSDDMQFMLAGSAERPIMNPCFVIRNWGEAETLAKLVANDRELYMGPDFRQGIIRDTDGTPTMVIWLKLESKETTGFEITKFKY
jgi:hypothetical protein